MRLSRRLFLGSAAAAATVASPYISRFAYAADEPTGPFTQAEMGYDFDALEPHIDTQTMMIHFGRHHAGQVRGVNRALKNHPDLHGKSIQALLRDIGSLPVDARRGVRNAGGGHANHTMFWSIMGPNGGGAPSGDLAAHITRDFGSFEAFQTAFNAGGRGQFGSGWVFLTVDGDGTLSVVSYPNQDNPLMDGKPMVMGNDVWEHAYYLKYQNRRGDYLAAWWNTLNWSAIEARFARILGGELIYARGRGRSAPRMGSTCPCHHGSAGAIRSAVTGRFGKGPPL